MSEYIDRKNDIISDLKACKTVFSEANISWAINGGVVLGYARYKDVMPWDTDIDIGIFGDITIDQWETLLELLKTHGFKKNGEINDFAHFFRNVVLDLHVFHKENSFYVCRPEPYKHRYLEKAKWFDEIQLVDFLDDRYPMPNFIEDFLDAHYGYSWKTNVIKNHAEYHDMKRGNPNDPGSWYLKRVRSEDGLFWWPVILMSGEEVNDFDELRNSVD